MGNDKTTGAGLDKLQKLYGKQKIYNYNGSNNISSDVYKFNYEWGTDVDLIKTHFHLKKKGEKRYTYKKWAIKLTVKDFFKNPFETDSGAVIVAHIVGIENNKLIGINIKPYAVSNDDWTPKLKELYRNYVNILKRPENIYYYTSLDDALSEDRSKVKNNMFFDIQNIEVREFLDYQVDDNLKTNPSNFVGDISGGKYKTFNNKIFRYYDTYDDAFENEGTSGGTEIDMTQSASVLEGLAKKKEKGDFVMKGKWYVKRGRIEEEIYIVLIDEDKQFYKIGDEFKNTLKIKYQYWNDNVLVPKYSEDEGGASESEGGNTWYWVSGRYDSALGAYRGKSDVDTK